MNNPQIVVAVILDSAVGPHQGGQVAAPVFHRITQQVLEYMHVPHDLPLAPQHQLLLAEAKTKEKDLEEGTPDHPGEPLETAEVSGDSDVARKPSALPVAGEGANATLVVPTAMRESELTPAAPGGTGQPSQAPAKNPSLADAASVQARLPASGTVVLDVEQGGIEVPSFVGKTVRGAVEAAQDAGLELEAVGSGVARQQTPAAGTHVATGSRVTVQFGR